MPQPKLIHPIEVELELMDRDNSVFDPYAREPVGQVIRQGESPGTGDRVIVIAQVSFYYAGAKMNYPMFERGGVTEDSVGYFVVRYKDLIKQALLELDGNGNFTNLRIKRGDRVIRWGHEYCDYYVEGFKPFGHYPKLNQTMLQVNFTDRTPGYQQGDL